MRTFFDWRSVSVLLLAVGIADCGSMSNTSSDANTAAGPNGSADFGTTGAAGSSASSGAPQTNAGTGGSAAVVAPPEMNVQKAFQAPVATARYVWSANPKTGRVAFIDSQTFQVKTVSAGEGPTYIAAVPADAKQAGTGDRAVVINVLSNEATYLSNNADNQIVQKTFQIASGANAWAISPDGHYAIAWTDVSRVTQPDATQGFQQISILDLVTPTAPIKAPFRTVGFRPSDIHFSVSPPRAFAVTEDGITVIDLATPGNPQVLKTIKVTDSTKVPPVDAGVVATNDAGPDGDAAPTNDAAAQSDLPPPAVVLGKASVSITPKGDYAIVRTEGSPVVTVIDLATELRWSWTLEGPVTGLDLADTGTSAVAVIRGSSRVAVLPVPGAATSTFPDFPVTGATIGSVVIAPQGKTALLFTNALPENTLTVLHLDDPNASYESIGLHAPVLSVFAAPTGESAIVIHNSFKGTAFQKPGAFSVVPLSGGRSPVIQETDAPPFSVAISPTGDRAIIPARSDQGSIYLTYLAHMDSAVVDRYVLASPPTAAGFVSQTGQAFIAQDHPEGRVTFIDGTSGQVRTITGFELGASVIEWSGHDGGAL